MSKHKENRALNKQYGLGDLAEAAGVTRDMINYYLRAGLLPKPQKIRSNRSIYTEQHLALILLILRFQNEAHLSLTEITDLFKIHFHDPESLELDFLAGTYRAKPDTQNQNKTRDFPLENVRLPKDFLQTLEQKGLINSWEKPSPSERKVAALILRGKASGLTLDFFVKAQDAVSKIVDAEKASLVRTLKTEQNYGELRNTLLEVDQIVNRWISTEKKRQIEKKAQERSIASLEKLMHYVYKPSEAFLHKYGTNNYISELKENLKTIEQHERLVHALFLTANHSLCEIEAQKLLESDTKNLRALCTLAHLNCIEGNIDASTDYAEKAYALNNHHGLTLCLLAFTNILQSTHASGIISPMKYVNKAIKLFEENESIKQSSFDRMENAFISIHAYGVQKSPEVTHAETKLFDYVINSLNFIISKLENDQTPESQKPFPGYTEHSLVRAHFYLSELQEQVGEKKKNQRSQQEVIRLDPISNFGSIIYMKQ